MHTQMVQSMRATTVPNAHIYCNRFEYYGGHNSAGRRAAYGPPPFSRINFALRGTSAIGTHAALHLPSLLGMVICPPWTTSSPPLVSVPPSHAVPGFGWEVVSSTSALASRSPDDSVYFSTGLPGRRGRCAGLSFIMGHTTRTSACSCLRGI